MSGEDLLQKLLLIGAILGALLVILERLSKLYTFLRPVVRPMSIIGSVLIPQGLLAWYYIYLAAINSHRIREGRVFVSLVMQMTVLGSLYTVIWAKWIYPALMKPRPEKTIESATQRE